ncbi:cytochrome C assembly family protein [Neptunomonas phycophila]|uniref:cytochrome C assembly family protein n=1 Tax=Neptunomonas phycophila TaxID=1572645 RepID=UPI0030FB4820
MLLISTLLAVLLYLVAATLQWTVLKGNKRTSGFAVRAVATTAVVLHTFSIYHTLHQPNGINLGFFAAGSLIAWLVAVIVTLSSLRQKIDNLFIGVLPMAALAAGLAVWGPELGEPHLYRGGLIFHILLSILAYSMFTVATFQAILLSRQDQALKQHHTRGLVASLPPLQTMERLLFEMLWIAMGLLSASLITGFLFVDDLLAQHLVHKTALSIIAWLLYAVLLWGRLIRGWRSQRAVRWTISGFVILMLGFFGSKLVIDLIYGG